MRFAVLALALLAVLGACGGDDSVEPAWFTCDQSGLAGHRSCTQFPWYDGYNEWYCGDSGGVWSAGRACPAQDRVASCRWPSGSLQIWYVGATVLADVEQQCATRGGSWTTYP
jgi:hypothetical protein